MAPPKYNPQITLGNLLQIVGMIVLAVSGFTYVKFQSDYNRELILTTQREVREAKKEEQQQDAVKEQFQRNAATATEIRIRGLEIGMTERAKDTENLENILYRIEARLARWESENK